MSCSNAIAPVMKRSMWRAARDGTADDACDGKEFGAGYGEE